MNDMRSPVLIVQLSDPHIGAEWGGGDPDKALAAAVESVRSMRIQPTAVLVSGDLADGAEDSEYERVRELLAPIGAPAFVLPGNHDERRAMRRHFRLPAIDSGPVSYSVDLGLLRLVVLDTTIPGEAAGALSDGQLEWLEGALANSPEQPTMIAMHHPPLLTGIPAWDEIGLSTKDRQLLAEVVGRHDQVKRIVAGHVHRTISAELAGRSVLTVPSTYVQARVDFGSHKVEFSNDPAGFAVHVLVGRQLVSFIQTVA